MTKKLDLENIKRKDVTIANMKKLRRERGRKSEWDLYFLVTGFILPKSK